MFTLNTIHSTRIVHLMFSKSSSPLPKFTHRSYRIGYSTETALVKVQSDILLNMDNHNVTQLVLIDLSAAFDTVDHDILKQILNLSFGASGTALNG